MGMFDGFTSLFKKKKTIENIDPEELRRERIKLEQIETRVTREIESLEKQKEEFFRKGVQGASQRQKVQIARKIKELDSLVRSKDKQLSLVSKNVRVLNGVAQVKENEKMMTQLGMGSVLSNMDLDELQAYVEKATVEGQFQMERFTGLLGTLESGDSLDMVDEDADTRAILEAMEAASATGDESAITEGIEKIDSVLHKEKDKDAELFG